MKIKNLNFVFIILIVLIFINFVSSEETDVFKINLKYLNEKITTDSVSLVKMNYFAPNVQEGKYKIELISYSGKILDSQKFDFSLEIFGLPEKTILDESTNELIIPYFLNAGKFVVYNGDKLVLEHDLSMYTSEYRDSKTKKYLFIFLGFILLVIIIYFLKKRQD